MQTLHGQTSLSHFVCLAETLLDKTLAMGGHYPPNRLQFEGHDAILADLQAGRGGVVITAHLGCLELLQATVIILATATGLVLGDALARPLTSGLKSNERRRAEQR